MSGHVPALAAGEHAAPRRSLVLAGGGMRVAYQAGVLVALEEHGLSFGHADGTSGGTINLAMLLSGVSPTEMCERWRTLDVRGFGSPLPLRKYLKTPDLPALGDADGIVRKVFPHLGIDPERIREARGIAGTFNVCNFTRKTSETIPHTEIDLDLLVAAISLPVFMPAVRRGECVYTDSVWIRDANVLEAARRDAEEVWLVWCIGNTPRYRDGLFNQYVHMIEIAANGSLFEDLDRIRERSGGRERPFRLHVIKPEYPLPLDPDFYLGRITGEELVAMGYADAARYLASAAPDGLPWGPELTLMRDSSAGASFRETLSGEVGGSSLSLRARIEVDDLDGFVAGPTGEARLTGTLEGGDLRRPLLLREGRLTLERAREGRGARVVYEAAARDEGEPVVLRAVKELRDDRGFDLWHDVTSARAKLRRGDAEASGELHSRLRRVVLGAQGQNVDSWPRRLRAAGRLGGSFLADLRAVYRPLRRRRRRRGGSP